MIAAGRAPRRLRAAGFLATFDRYTVPPLLVGIHEDLGVSLGAAATMASAYLFAYGLGQPAWAVLSDRVGRVAVIRVGLVGGIVACLVAALAQRLDQLVVARVLAGLCFGALIPAVVTYLGDTVPVARRQHAMATLLAATTAGIAVATVAGGVVAEVTTWRVAFVASTALGAFVLFLLWSLPEAVHEQEAPPLRALPGVLRRRWVPTVLWLGVLEGAVVFGALTFAAASLQLTGVQASVAGLAAAGFGASCVVCTPLAVRAIRTIPTPWLLAGSTLVSAVGLAAPAVEVTTATVVAATLALGCGFGMSHSTLQLWATEVHPQARAFTVSMFVSAGFVGGACAAAAASPLADAGHFELIYLGAACAAVALALVGAVGRARYLRERATPAYASRPNAPKMRSTAVSTSSAAVGRCTSGSSGGS